MKMSLTDLVRLVGEDRAGDLLKGAKEAQASGKMRLPKTPKKTKPEELYERMLLLEFRASDGYEVRFERLTLVLDSGTRYTPDFTVWLKDRLVICVEVKGRVKLKSFERSTTKFKEAITSFKDTRFRHAWQAMGSWQSQEKCFNAPPQPRFYAKTERRI